MLQLFPSPSRLQLPRRVLVNIMRVRRFVPGAAKTTPLYSSFPSPRVLEAELPQVTSPLVSSEQKPSVLGAALIPKEFRQDAYDVLCEERAMGVPLKDICLMDKMPPKRWFVRTFTRDAELLKRYRDAFDLCIMLEADRLLEIADNVSGDEYRDKLRISVRQWLLERRDSRNFGAKVEVAHEIGSELKELFENARIEGRLPPGGPTLNITAQGGKNDEQT